MSIWPAHVAAARRGQCAGSVAGMGGKRDHGLVNGLGKKSGRGERGGPVVAGRNGQSDE